jgi:hypothetical protein
MEIGNIKPIIVYNTLENLGFQLYGKDDLGLAYSRRASQKNLDIGLMTYKLNEGKMELNSEISFPNYYAHDEDLEKTDCDLLVKGYQTILNTRDKLIKQGYDCHADIMEDLGSGLELYVDNVDLKLPQREGIQKIKGLTSIIEKEFNKLK